MSDHIDNLTPEERLLLSLCRVEFTEKQKDELSRIIRGVTDWDHFVRAANEHCMIAQCWYTLDATGNSATIPSGAVALMRNAFFRNLAQNTFIYRLLAEIALLAKREGVRIVLLKGSALEKTLYGNRGLRHLSDIDILVEFDKALYFREVLLKNGFASVPEMSPLHRKLLPYLKRHLPALSKDGIYTELHARLFDNGNEALTTEFLKSSAALPGEDPGLFLPPVQLHFLYLVRHLDRHFRTADLKLKFFADLLNLTYQYRSAIFNHDLAGKAREAGLEQELQDILSLLTMFWGVSFEDIQGVARVNTGRSAVSDRFISFLRNPETYTGQERSDPLFSPLKEIPGLFRKTLFLAGYIFPSIGYMKSRYHCRTAAGALVRYPARWGGIFSRAIRAVVKGR